MARKLTDAQYQKLYGRPKPKTETKKKPQSSSTSKPSASVNKSIQAAQEKGKKQTAKTNVSSQQSFTPTRTTKVSGKSKSSSQHLKDQKSASTSSARQMTTRERINQKSYGTTRPEVRTRTKPTNFRAKGNSERQQNAQAQMNLKQTKAEETRTRIEQNRKDRAARAQAAQTQKSTGGITRESQEQTRNRLSAVGNRLRNEERAKAGQAVKSGARAQTSVREVRDTASMVRNDLRNAITDNGAQISKEDDRRARQLQKSGIQSRNSALGIKESATGATISGTLKQTLGAHLKALGDDSNELSEYKAMLDNGVAMGKWSQSEADRALKSMMRTSRYSRYEGWENSKQHKTFQAIYKKGEQLYNQGTSEVESAMEGASKAKKAYLQALGSGVGMATDMAAGPAWWASMVSRTYGGERGTVEKLGGTEWQDRNYAGLQALKEVGTEFMFQGAGIASSMVRRGPVKGISLADRIERRLLANQEGRIAGAISGARRLAIGTGEENLEEVAGWLLDPAIANYTYANDLWARDSRNQLKEQSNALRQEVAGLDRASVESIAAYINTDDYVDKMAKEYMKSGAPEGEAHNLAEAMREYMAATLSGDNAREDELENRMVSMLSGQNPYKKTLNFEELAETIASTTLLTAATGLPGAVTTSSLGNTLFNDPNSPLQRKYGPDATKIVVDAVINSSDEKQSIKAQSLKDRLDSGKDLTGTQKYELYQAYVEKNAEEEERLQASRDVASREIKRNDYIVPFSFNEDGRIDRTPREDYEFYQAGDSTQKAYEQNYASALDTARTLQRVDSEDDASISEASEDKAMAVADAVASVKDGGLTVGKAQEFAFGNVLARQTLKEETGIDLDNYIVKNKDGKINYAKTNAAAQDALFKIASNNLVKTAASETATFTDHRKGEIDKDLLSRFGAEGQAMWQEVSKGLDVKKAQTYLASGNAASYMYAAGRNTNLDIKDVENAMGNVFRTVDKSILSQAFAAGRRDREIANTPGIGQTVTAGDAMSKTSTQSMPVGELTVDENIGRSIPDSELQVYRALAEATGTNIHLAAAIDIADEDGNIIGQANGTSAGNTITLNTNARAEQNLGYVFMHEMTHQIKTYAPREYTKLENLIRETWFEKDYAGMQNALKRKIDLYERNGQSLDETKAMEEIVADSMAEAMDDPNFAWAICNEDVGLGKSILNSIRDALRSIRSLLASGNVKNPAFHNSLLSYLDILSEAEHIWIHALHEATKAKANQAINDWQDEVNAESVERYSITEPTKKSHSAAAKYERGEKLTHKQFNSYYSAHKLNLRGQDNIEEQIDDIKTNGFVSTTALSNVVPAGINDYVNPEQPNYTEGRYGAREGDVVLLVPKDYLDQKNDRIENGFVPRDYEIVTVERDFQPYYELYEKAYDETNTGERFSLNEPVERVKDLVAVHNVKISDLPNMLELGGMPMPSIAVTKASMGHDKYGDISFLFHSDTIDPAMSRYNKVYGGDAYTPTFPAVRYKPNSEVIDRLKSLYYDNYKELGGDAMRGLYRYSEGLEDEINSAGGEAALIERAKKDTGLMESYLAMQGKPKVEYVYKTEETTLSDSQVEMHEMFIKELGEDVIKEVKVPEGENPLAYRKEWLKKHETEIEAAYTKWMKEDLKLDDETIQKVLDDQTTASYVKLFRETLKYLQDGATTTKEVYDGEATREAITKAAEEAGFDAWVDETFKGVEAGKGIRNNKDMFTNMGNRRSWDTLHDPVTLENVVAIMRSEMDTGSNGFLGANPKGAAQKSYNSLDEIIADEDRLEMLTDEEYSERSDEALTLFTDVCASIVESNPKRFENSFVANLDVGEYIAEVLNETRNKDKMHKLLNRDYGMTVSDEQMDRLWEAIQAISEVPTGYFEAKPKRAVGLDEIRAALVPNNMDKDLTQQLADKGVDIVEYDPEVEGDRTAKLNEVADAEQLKFSLSPEQRKLDDDYMTAVTNYQKLYDADDIGWIKAENEIANMVDQAAFNAGYATKAYHGTPSEPFNVFNRDYIEHGRLHGDGFYFSPYEDIANQYGETRAYYLKTGLLNEEDLLSDQWLGAQDYKDFTSVDEALAFYEEKQEEYEKYGQGMARFRPDVSMVNGHYRVLFTTVGVFDQGLILVAMEPEYAKFAEPITYAEDGRVIPLSQRFNSDNQDLRYSLPTSDAEGNALSNGQIEFFEQSKVRNGAGQLKVMLHGTDADFTEFDPSKARPGTLGRAFYFSDSATHAGQYGNVGKYYLNLENPLTGNTHDITKDQLRRFVAELAEDEDYGIENYGADATIDSVTDSVWGGTDFAMLRDLNLSAVGDFAEAVKVFNRVNGTDYDGIITDVETAAFYPEQIKRTDNLNPTLSKDTRYSITDSDGRDLSDGQVSYFRNSQARDEQGRLVPVFHATFRGGFTVFDPSYSDDKRSLFFAASKDISLTYGGIDANRPIDINFKPFNSLDEFKSAVVERYQQLNDEQETFDDIFGADALVLKDNGAANTELSYNDWLNNPELSKDYDLEFRIPGGGRLRASNVDDLLAKASEAMRTDQRGYYECYLNLENPLVIDADGAEWDDIIPGGSKIDREASVMIRNAAHYRRIAEGIKDADVVKERISKAEELEKNNSVEFHIFNGSDSEMVSFIIPRSEDLAAEQINEYFGFGIDDDFGHDIAAELLGEVEHSGYSQYSGPDMRALLDEFPYTTRELAELAEAEGHDGVIFRDLRDIGGLSDGIRLKNEITDVYIAFSSNQVKDVNNLNPTENPDIRYSITDEDEAKSRMAYEDSIDNSIEELARYEEQLDSLNEDTYFAKPFSEEKIADFYAGLRAVDSRVYSDPVLEEDAVRMAQSKNDFYNNLNAKWQDRWTTEGEVLDIGSVKTNVRNLVMGVMQNSATDSKYKSDLVKKTLIDIKNAYQLMKQDRADVASALLYHSAQRMIDNVEFYVDDSFDQYKELRDYLRTTRISLGEEYWADVDYDAFRKNNFGRLKLVKGITNVDQVYQELEEMFPEWFNEDETMTVPDQLLQIEHVLDSVQPYKEAYSSEEAAELAFDIADDLYEIMVNGKELTSLADRYKQSYERKVNAMKQRHAEAMLRMRKARDEGVLKERAKWRAREEARKERTKHRAEFDSIKKSYDKLTKRLLDNTADSNIPEQYKKELAGLLAAFDFQTVASKKREAKTYHRSQNAIKMSAIRTALRQIETRSQKFFHMNDAIVDIIDELLGVNSEYPAATSIEGKTIDELSNAELNRIDKLLKALIHEFNTYKNVRIQDRNEMAQDIADAQVSSALEHANKFGAGTDWFGIRGGLDRVLNLDEVTPAYLFRQIDRKNEGLGLMWKEIGRAHDKYIRNTDQLSQWMEEITGKYHNKGKGNKKYGAAEIEEWRRSRSAVEFNLTNGSIKLTPAQMMSLAMLAKRPQAYQHMVGAGVVAAPVNFQAKMETDLKRKTNRALPLVLTDADIKLIVSQLTPEQRKMADDLQQLMANQMAEWGNEASMDVIGIRLFEEPDYFPIKSDRAALEKDLTPDQFEQAIRNFGFTKAVQPGARNSIMIDDIFDVVTEHCNNMNLYNSYSKVLNDFMKVYNKHTYQEDGSDYTVAQALGHAYSQKVPHFIMTFLKDINGNVSKDRTTGIESMLQGQLANAKKASVFANIRVLLQQPTAITRAFAVISPKYLKGIKIEHGAMEEMFEHCPIAKWKSWGYYDINMGKQIEDIIMNEGNFVEDIATQAYGAADNVTWTAIWQMVKAEMKDKHPDIVEGSDEFWYQCNERMREIVDLTQVVDSPMHRSHAMRSKSFIVKMATSFMAEPTLTFNMIRDGYIRAREAWAQGNKKEAMGIMNKTMSVFVLQAASVAAAAAIADALRGKSPDGGDDDEDKTFIASWWANTIANFQDELRLWNKIYYLKDISSLFEGYEAWNLGTQGITNMVKGYNQMTKKLAEGSKTPWWNIYQNLFGGLGYMTGIPIKTLMKDGRAIFEFLGGQFPESWVGDNKKSEPIVDKNSALGKLIAPKDSYKASSMVNVSAESHWYDYENNPITVKDGSALDILLNHFGLNLTETEKAAAIQAKANEEFNDKSEEIAQSVADYSGEEKAKKTWSKVSTYMTDTEGKSLNDIVAEGDYYSLLRYRQMYIDAGNDAAYFDERVMAASKKALKTSIVYDATSEQISAQERIRDYMLDNGMSEAEISEIAYKSDTARDLKVAMRLGDEELVKESLEPLVNAGLSRDDFDKCWKNRNRVNLKTYSGRYKDQLKSTGNYTWPVDGTITSDFGHRDSPGGIGSTNHQGIDIGASQGTPVAAADGGTVVMAGWYGGYGKTVQIQHDDGTITQYSHLSWWDVHEGDVVGQGQEIGLVGSTGNSTGPHLHFGVLKNDSYVDPMDYLNDAGMNYDLSA